MLQQSLKYTATRKAQSSSDLTANQGVAAQLSKALWLFGDMLKADHEDFEVIDFSTFFTASCKPNSNPVV